MSSASTYVKGLLYEVLSIAVLRRYKFDIQHCGKSGDRGIDFRGQWILPDNQLSVIGKHAYDYNVYKTYSFNFLSQSFIFCSFSHAIIVFFN